MDTNEITARINELKRGEWFSYYSCTEPQDQWTSLMQSAKGVEYRPIQAAIDGRYKEGKGDITMVQERIDRGFAYWVVGI